MAEGINQAYQDTPVANTSNKKDYYGDSDGRRVGDFLLGFFGIWIIGLLIYFTIAGLLSTINLPVIGGGLVTIAIMLEMAFLIFAIIFAFVKNRKYIGLGIIVSALVPLLIFGACLIMIMSMGGIGF